MQVTLELPEDLARLFGDNPEILNRATLEALTLEALRMGKLTISQSRHLLAKSHHSLRIAYYLRLVAISKR